MRIVFLPVAFVVLIGCEAAPTAVVGPGSLVAPASRPPHPSSRGQMVATIEHLRRVAMNPQWRARAWFGTTSRRRASVEQVLAELTDALAWMDANHQWDPDLTPASPDAWASDYGGPQPSGTSWIEVTGAPETLRYVYYRAYTVCINCGIGDYPRGFIRARQYAGTVETLHVDRTFSGGQGYTTGEVMTTLTGSAQTGTIATDHWIDVWLGNDPHYYSSASGQV